jgi:hypothetical protein
MTSAASRVLRTFVALSPGVFALACNGSEPNLGAACDPVAHGGDDQSVSLDATVTLDGSASTACQDLQLSYTWTFLQVPDGSALDDSAFSDNDAPTASTPTFTPDAVGAYVVSLSVHDGVTESSADPMVITVSSDDVPPTADAGADQTGQVGTLVAFDGTLSSDPSAASLLYLWTLASPPDGSGLDSSDVFDSGTANASLVPDVPGTYVLSLIVSDGISWSEPDYVALVAATDNERPIADAGETLTFGTCSGTTVELNGFGSYDPDGDAITYLWSVSAVPAGSDVTDLDLDDPTSANPVLTWDALGSYTLSLQVSDGELASANDVVTLTMTGAGANSPPDADAGADQIMAMTAECVNMGGGVFSCEDCPAVSFTVDASGSSDPDGDDVGWLWSAQSAEATVQDPTMAVTVVDVPAMAATRNVVSTAEYDVSLEVGDCELSTMDTVQLTVTCRGE